MDRRTDRPTAERATTKIAETAPPGPVPFHRRAKMGATGAELASNPYGNGKPSTENKIANDRKGY
jgi:hypothetical protein